MLLINVYILLTMGNDIEVGISSIHRAKDYICIDKFCHEVICIQVCIKWALSTGSKYWAYFSYVRKDGCPVVH